MRRKAIDKRLRSIARLRDAIAAHREHLGRRLAERPAALPDEGLDYRPIFDHLAAELAAIEQRLDGAERAYAADQIHLSRAREARNHDAARLYALQCDVKRLLEAALGDRRELSTLGFGATSKSPQTLTLQVRRTIPFLRNLKRCNPAPIVAASFNGPAFADRLQTELERVEALCQAAEEADLATSGSRCDADDAVAEVDRVFPWVLQVFESLCHLVGEARLARRLRGR